MIRHNFVYPNVVHTDFYLNLPYSLDYRKAVQADWAQYGIVFSVPHALVVALPLHVLSCWCCSSRTQGILLLDEVWHGDSPPVGAKKRRSLCCWYFWQIYKVLWVFHGRLKYCDYVSTFTEANRYLLISLQMYPQLHQPICTSFGILESPVISLNPPCVE